MGVDSDCQTLITLNAGNIVGITNGLNHGPYDIVEDTLLGVVNNTGGTVFSLNLSGNGIFGFDGDGACTFIDCGGTFSGTAQSPGTMEPAAGIRRTVFIDRASPLPPKMARDADAHLVPANVGGQPAVAARGAGSAGA